ncbi:odorant receptor 82a-like [Epargyreus clarus]|uniref:odorant receptor 82a-like n=1 Tax=Epargyreus clarus TaxID=520877 RepID=UPI003C2BD1C7
MKLSLNKRNGSFVSIIGRWMNIGIWMDTNNYGIHCLVNISIFCFVITNILQVIALIQARDDQKKLIECFSVLSFCGMGLYKLMSLKGGEQRWRSLLASASNLELQQLIREDPTNADYESDGEEDTTFENHVGKYTQKFISTSNVLWRIYAFTGVVYVLSPFLEYALMKFQGADILEYPHILPGWTPLDELSFIGYVITVLAEGIASIYVVGVHVAFDLSVIGMMIFIQGQFFLLQNYGERIGGRGKQCVLSRKKDVRAHYRISKCHFIHVSLMKSLEQLRSLTQNILGIYFIVAALTLCSVAVQFKSEELSTPQLMSLLQYMCGTLIQLFLFCNYGDAVINESSIGLGIGPFACAWWGLSPHIRREIALLCVGMTRRCSLLAGPFHSLDLPAFIQIVRTAYSYYAVIRQKTDE